MRNENPIDFLLSEDKPVNYRAIIQKYLQNWKWFALGLFVTITIAFIVLRYSQNQYLVSTTILIDDSEKGGTPAELAAFEDLGLVTSSKKSIDNELGILNSRNLMESVVEDLGINVTYYTKGKVNTIEHYKNNVPFKINFFIQDSLLFKIDTSFAISAISESKFLLINTTTEQEKEYLFGETIKTKFGEINITPNLLNNVELKDDLIVVISPVSEVAEGIRKNVKMELLDNSNLIEISLTGPLKQKSIDILNTLVKIYNQNAVDDKRKIGENTSAFLNERLALIEKDLSNTDKDIELFKTTNQLTDITSEASLVVGNNDKIEKDILQIKTQLRLADYVADYLKTNNDQLIPSNLGLNDGAVSLNTENYNRLLLERNRILKGSGLKNPVVLNLDDQLNQLRASILQGLVNLKSSLNISLQEAYNQKYAASSRIGDVPKHETQFKDIQRQQTIVETVYLYLLQKREENSIALSVTVPNSKIIDTAGGSDTRVSPKPILILLIAGVMGLVIPFLVLFVIFMLDDKVHTAKEIEAAIRAPYIGDIPEIKNKSIVLTKQNVENISESFRMLRSNILFMLSKIKDRGKAVFVTSTISGEGKSFISANLAAVLALSNKKVLLIGADIRKPKLKEYLEIKIEKGLTHYLMDEDLNESDIIFRSKELNIDVIDTTVIAPNPSEVLLLNERFDQLIAFGKANYDFVIVDTAPVKVVTDTFLISENADLFIYVIRANYLERQLLELPEKLYQEKRLPHMTTVLNYAELKKGYGYGYGYGEHFNKEPWYKRIFSK
ncbi:polysaccharide biosynthesis tyrosine autokinase [Lutibacter sp. HS1-25]|uniref:GumC family protein n=1 Tax=Lutibacter sp. HS1-25 TaxID=2485000 RepID=UPI001013983D|nr:polysaccharide biosynthesis tyrosine autokinase [Lutibacter sp. HS1-25]RXP61860.1 polysaccharide biosynthesis tyrosine autokinase [Lutibacter sp. HS1-25]